MKHKYSVKEITVISLLIAFAYAITVVGRIPMIAFLKYDPKDIIIVLTGIIFYPSTTIAMSLIISIIEMMTVSSTGFIGLFMNVLATIAYATLAVIIYKKKNNNKSLLIGLMAGTAAMTLVMIGWNYLITPFYLKIPQSEVVKMLIPIILPFNIIKAGINSGVIYFIYKPFINMFSNYHIIDSKIRSQRSSNYFVAILLIVSALILLKIVTKI